jgi:hypothetical protein
MDDADVLGRISELVAEEQRLLRGAGTHGLSDPDRARLRSVEEALDQAWDLLRRRRAREEYGENPDVEHARPVGEVEGYLQ